MPIRLIILFSIALLISACAPTTTPNLLVPHKKTSLHPSLPTAYDYQVLDKNLQALSLAALVEQLQDSQVVLIGEYHGNHASHLLQMRLLEALHQYGKQHQKPVMLSMEMFARNQQGILDKYMQGAIGERHLINESPAWKNYQASYRPLVEYAKQHAIPVVAANAPGDIIRCIGHKGRGHINTLSITNRKHLALQPFAEIPGYDTKFFKVMSQGKNQPSPRQKQSYLAQLARDNTMAESITRARRPNPNSLVIHLNGSFHSEDHLGTAGALKRLKPTGVIKVITPLHPDAWSELYHRQSSMQRKNDFYYLLNPQPKAFVQTDYQQKVHAALFANSRKKAKLCP